MREAFHERTEDECDNERLCEAGVEPQDTDARRHRKLKHGTGKSREPADSPSSAVALLRRVENVRATTFPPVFRVGEAADDLSPRSDTSTLTQGV